MVSMTKMFKNSSKTHNNRQKKRTKEDCWFCVGVIALIVFVAVVISYSIQNANEKFIKSDYHIQVNNMLYNLQSENGTALLVTFKNKFLKKSKNQTQLLQDVFNETITRVKFPQLNYEILRTTKNEALLRLYVNDSQMYVNSTMIPNIPDIIENNTEITENQTQKINDSLRQAELKLKFEQFFKFFKKSKKLHTMEYRHFSTYMNPKQKSFYTSGQHTKSKETLDYKIRFHHGPYLYIDPVKKNVTKDYVEITTQPATQIIDDSPYDIGESENIKSEDLASQRIILNKYEQLQKDEENDISTSDDKEQDTQTLIIKDSCSDIDLNTDGGCNQNTIDSENIEIIMQEELVESKDVTSEEL
eukprot:403330786